ncbi:NAD-dependent epimerase [Cyanobacterium aponinum AL20118]|uniref:SDR family NAD(P)-dependent oxidoreductase n=2 Tax=Cyanobacterium aponinum TaxID=379064 RepID=A0A844GVP2_9CHRO|nr:NAD-dependent epimerase [Cyanobacterium aponinum]MBD2394844.1 NAD-dependent epimerase [Cyanobacterium aponinum FACHB-4101]MTF38929.1 SDR family NAD(P)-dependent oxidoreductase [Cyanobacterium aponinum 0216]PHV62760.1 capsular biosynthesis protein CpsI [Cyanobacterium aponinum IPPAS B-1201]WPF90030.1 NAD-dependent epimerase [Cyanobacterium aponinum AL20115]
METILITGSSGFIGFHLSQRLLNDGYSVIGIDNMNDYYDVSLKQARLEILKQHHNFQFFLLDLVDRTSIMNLFKENKITTVVNLAAQAGVRYSLENPHAYVDSNLIGFVNILEACRHHNIQHLVYASSSSVYGANKKIPFSTQDNVDNPVSLYAATKKANELMAHTYSHLYNIPTTGLRFFTVYGTYGRPDMAYFIFTKNILEGKKIKVFNYGDMQRDFTYIDDIIEGVVRVMKQIPTPQTDNPNSKAPYRLYNIGNNKPVKLIDFITTIEKSLGVTAEKEFLPIQPGDVPITYADVDDLYKSVGFKPSTPIEKGIDEFVKWYREFYQN